MERQMILELLSEIKALRTQVKSMEKWLKIQTQNFQDENERLTHEIRSLLIQTNVLVEKMKRSEKINRKADLINKRF